LIRGSVNQLALTVRGGRDAVDHVLAIRIDEYRRGQQTFFANDQNPALPLALAGLQTIAGLTIFPHPRHADKATKHAICGLIGLFC